MEKIKLTLALCGFTVCLALLNPFAARGQQNKPSPAAPQTSSQTTAPPNYEKFTHKTHTGVVKVPGTNQAQDLKCDSCHDQRDLLKELVPTTNRNKELKLKFPGHKACVECHVQQFTAKPQQTCTICHDTKQGLTARPPQRDFAPRYDFNAFFGAFTKKDGTVTNQHEMHMSYNLPSGQKTDCSFCHAQTAKPAVLKIASHPECYVCHSPASGDQKAAQKSGCAVCHTEQQLNPRAFAEKYVTRAYGALFTHKSHVGYVNNKCDVCHTISGGYNQNSPTGLRTKQHVTPDQRGGRGCFSCHDGGQHYGRTVFSGEPGTDGGGSCKRCHTREDAKVFPSSGQ